PESPMPTKLPRWLSRGWAGCRAPRRGAPAAEGGGRVRKRRLCLEDLEPRDVPSAVSYHGGDLLTYVHVGALYYGNAWHDHSNQQAIGYINSFLSYIVQSPYMDMLSEYYQSGVPSFDPPNVGRGVFVGGWIQNVNTGSVVTDDG